MSDESKAPRDAPTEPSPAPPVNTAEAKMQAAMADTGLQQAIRELNDALHEPDPPAPNPIVVLPEKGGEVLIAQTEAAVAYVRPTAKRPGPVPKDTLTRVRLDERVDPRRQRTEPRVRSEVVPQVPPAEPSPWEKEAKAAPLDAAALPSSHAPSSRPPPSVMVRPAPVKEKPSRRPALLAMGLGTGFTLGVVVFLALRPPGGESGLAADTPTARTGSTVALVTGAAPPAMTEPVIEATTLGSRSTGSGDVPEASTATTATGSATTSSAPVTSGARPAPKGREEIYIDAASPPKNAPTAQPSALPAPTVAPAPTVVPTAPPSATSTSRPFVPFTVEKDG